MHDSFRHTGHGSPFGPSWGSPAFLDPVFLDNNVQLRNLDVKGLDRRRKCASYQVKERKSNAVKQFAYNKLINERTNDTMSTLKSKPNRPPQPKITNHKHGTQEGVLIDLSPENSPENLKTQLQQQQNGSFAAMISSIDNTTFCILDAPIDVPTVNDIDHQSSPSPSITTLSSLQFNLPSSSSLSSPPSKTEPPPYQMPPTYSNTIEFSQNNSNNRQQDNNDPFDTSGISDVITTTATNAVSTIATSISSSSSFLNTYSNIDATSNNSSLNASQSFANFNSGFQKQQQEKYEIDLSFSSNSSKGAISKYKTTASIQSPAKKSPNFGQTSGNFLQFSSVTEDNSQNQNSIQNFNESLLTSSSNLSIDKITTEDYNDNNSISKVQNDSMTVNLSNLSINDYNNSSNNNSSIITSEKKLDKSFIAELEKDMYKNDTTYTSNLNLNSAQSYTKDDIYKDNSIASISPCKSVNLHFILYHSQCKLLKIFNNYS